MKFYVIEARSDVYWNGDGITSDAFTPDGVYRGERPIDRAIKFADADSANLVLHHLLDKSCRALCHVTEHTMIES